LRGVDEDEDDAARRGVELDAAARGRGAVFLLDDELEVFFGGIARLRIFQKSKLVLL